MNDYTHTMTLDQLVNYRRTHEYRGLFGQDFSGSSILKYYKAHFAEDFVHYFPRATREDGYVSTLYIDGFSNVRTDDGAPGRNGTENMFFAALVLYMYIAQQSILRKIGDGFETVFHQCSGWPQIWTGPGGGPYLDPLRTLEYAGLLPLKHETPLFLEAVKAVFSLFRQEFNATLNGRNPAMKGKPSAAVFLDAIRKGRVKQNIIKYMDAEEAHIQDLLRKWGASSATNACEILHEEGIQICDYRK